MVDPKLSAKASEQLGLPPGLKTYSPFPFGGMNVQASPIALADNEFLYVENFVKLGDGNMRAAMKLAVTMAHHRLLRNDGRNREH